MKLRTLGSSGLQVTPYCLGLWGVGGPPFWHHKDDDAAIRTMQKAFDLGINFFDTAPAYGCGHSEELVAKALKSHYHEITVATKVGVRWDDKQNFSRISSRKSILEEIDLSLKRLDTGCIDLYQVHWPDPETPIRETFETLIELQQAGKIRHIGVSNYNIDQMTEVLKHAKIVSLQPRFNLFDRSIETKVADFCIKHKIGIIAYSPLASGILTGKYTKDTKFTDWRSRGASPHFKEGTYEQLIEKTDKLKEYAGRRGKSIIELALAWVMAKKGIVAAIGGANTPEQIEANVKAMDWELTPEEVREIEEIVER